MHSLHLGKGIIPQAAFPGVQSNRIRGEEITDLFLLSCHEPHAKRPFASKGKKKWLECLSQIYKEVCVSVDFSCAFACTCACSLSLSPLARSLSVTLVEHTGENTKSLFLQNPPVTDRAVRALVYTCPLVGIPITPPKSLYGSNVACFSEDSSFGLKMN